MLDEKFKEIVRLRDEVIKHQNTISAQNQQIRNLQKDNSKLKKALQKQKKEINGKS
jgi:predicted nuclease with TOPRIM domain